MKILKWAVPGLFGLLAFGAAAGSQEKSEGPACANPAPRTLTLELRPDGSVLLTVTKMTESGQKEVSTYRAGSPDEFAQKCPEIVRLHGSDLWPAMALLLPNWPTLSWKEIYACMRSADPSLEDPEPWIRRQVRSLERWRGEVLAERAAPGTRHLGLSLGSVTPTLAHHLGLSPDEGAVVVYVEPGTEPDRAGLKPHDVIVSIHGRPVKVLAEIRARFLELAGTDFTLDVFRKGERLTLHVPSAL